MDNQEKTAEQAQMLANRLTKRYKHLKKWARRIGTTSFRLYDRDIPEVPLLIELWSDGTQMWAVGALWERPYEKPDDEEETWLAAMQEAAARALALPVDHVILKRRRRQRGDEQYEKLATQGVFLDTEESALRFHVNLSDYLDTGLFLDHRATRRLVQADSAHKRVLNLFCYTGSFSVHAAKGGALTVDSVDLSNTYLEWAGENLALNGFESVKVEPELFTGREKLPGRFRLVRADALRFMEEASKKKLTWDEIILDPPTFSNSSKMEGTLDVRRDATALIELALSLLAPAGKLWFSTNARGFKLKAEDFPGYDVRDITRETLDEDVLEHTKRYCYIFTRT